MKNQFPKRYRSKFRSSSALIVCSYIVAVFFLGGGSRSDISSLLILRPLSFGALIFGILVRKEEISSVKNCLIAIGLMAAVILLELLPLAPSVWTLLPGRELVSEIDRTLELERVWRPIALHPHLAWNALFSLIIPAATFALMGRIHKINDHRKVMRTILIIGLLGAMLGVAQLLSGSTRIFYLYRVSNFDSATGLFANRNHHALLLAALLPILSYMATAQEKSRNNIFVSQLVLLFLFLMVIPLIVLTGSRAGLVHGLIGLIFAGLILELPNPARRGDSWYSKVKLRSALFIFVTAAVLVSAFAGRLTAFDRWGLSDSSAVGRLDIFPTLVELASLYFPVGSGAGSFVSVFKIAEPDVLLQPAYFNHAHNDYLEIIIEHGFLGSIFILGALALLFYFGFDIIRRRLTCGSSSEIALGLVGLSFLIMCALGSLVDYPLRVPSIQVLASISVVWMIVGRRQSSYRERARKI